MLVDTGATITILRSDLLNCLPRWLTEQMEMVNSSLVTATGERTPFLGKCKVDFNIDSTEIKHEVLFAGIQNEEILGYDFMAKHKCNICLNDFTLTVEGKCSIPLQSSAVGSNCCRVLIAENTTIPANSEVIISGKPSQ